MVESVVAVVIAESVVAVVGRFPLKQPPENP
jgi:hypothetical protein